MAGRPRRFTFTNSDKCYGPSAPECRRPATRNSSFSRDTGSTPASAKRSSSSLPMTMGTSIVWGNCKLGFCPGLQPRSIRNRLLFLDSEVCWRGHTEQILHEIIPPAAVEIQVSAFAMKHVRHKQHVEVFVGLDQGVDQTHGFDWMDIFVYIAVLEQQMALSVCGDGLVRLRRVVWPQGIALVQLVPPCRIETGIVVPGDRNADFIEIGILQECVRRTITASRSSINTYTCEIHVGVPLGHLPDHGDVILKDAAKVSVGEEMERARASRRAATVDHDHNKAKLGHGLLRAA